MHFVREPALLVGVAQVEVERATRRHAASAMTEDEADDWWRGQGFQVTNLGDMVFGPDWTQTPWEDDWSDSDSDHDWSGNDWDAADADVNRANRMRFAAWRAGKRFGAAWRAAITTEARRVVRAMQSASTGLDVWTRSYAATLLPSIVDLRLQPNHGSAFNLLPI